MSTSRKIISVAVIVICVFHVVPVAQRLLGVRQNLWPILAYAMYKDARPPGPIEAIVGEVVGITESGKEVIFTPDVTGLHHFGFERYFVSTMWRGTDQEAAQRLADRYNRGRDDPFVKFRLTSTAHTLENSEISTEELPVAHYTVNPPVPGAPPPSTPPRKRKK